MGAVASFGRWTYRSRFSAQFIASRVSNASFVLNCVQEDTDLGNTTTVTVRVPAGLKNRLDKLADATARSRSWLAAHALEVYVQDQEWQLATIGKGAKDIQTGRIVSHEKTARWLRSWGKKRELTPPSCE